MGIKTSNSTWHPVSQEERCSSLDVIRGVALFGVLLVNLMSDFRVSLAENIQTFHTHPGWANRAVDILVAGLLEFKAFSLFSLLFGVGLAVFDERAQARMVRANRFQTRRLLILLGIGLTHLLLIWNGDILTLYAICGLLLLPFLRFSALGLAALGIICIFATVVLPLDFLWPNDENQVGLIEETQRVYSAGSFGDVLAFHFRETQLFIVPILASVLPRTLGLMALGAAAWRIDIFRNPRRHLLLLWSIFVLGGAIGGATTALSVYSRSTGQPSEVLENMNDFLSIIPLALAYGTGLVIALCSPVILRLATPFAAAGQMALTNYLTQSVILSILFYGYGFGLYGKIGSAPAALIGVILYALQLALSMAWLSRFQFGPVEWLWRSLTYGRWQTLKRTTAPSQ